MITVLQMALLNILLAGAWPIGEPAKPMTVRIEAFPGLANGPMTDGCVTIHSGLTLFGDNALGGLSAMRFDGNKAYLLSDSALGFTATLQRDENGYVRGLAEVESSLLTDQDGELLSRPEDDTEGLVMTGDDSVLISTEESNTIRPFTLAGRAWVAQPPLLSVEDRRLGKNAGFEALAQLGDGRLIAISEGTDRKDEALVLISPDETGKGEWQSSSYRPASDFNVTDADIDPATGDLIVLERAFSRLKGPRARLVRVAAKDIGTAGLAGQELARLNFFHGVDNMEGIEVERMADGRLLAHLISDDNFNDVQRTVLMGMEITDQCGGSPSAKAGPGPDPAAEHPVEP